MSAWAFRAGAAALLGLALSFTPARAAAAETYSLGPQDQIRVKTYEWRASRDMIFEWTALNDVFTVGADGALFLPFAGRIPVEGLGTDAIADVIARNLARNMELGQAPDVAVEIVRFRPFYILGDVAQPGEFPYRPELNVLKAVSVAGGLPVRADGLGRVEREIIAERGDISQLSLTRATLLARQARLRAEAANAGQIAFPAELTRRTADAAAAIMVEQERTIFATRQEGLSTQLRALDELRGFLEREIDSLGRQVGFLDQQIASVREELGSVIILVDKGLAAAPRQLALERSLLQIQGDRLTVETALLRARQEASRTELSILELRNTRASEVADELRETELGLSEIQRRTDTALVLLDDSETEARRLGAPGGDLARIRPIYTILRRVGSGSVTELAADETTEVRPGDTIRVELPLLPGSAARSTTGSVESDPLEATKGDTALAR